MKSRFDLIKHLISVGLGIMLIYTSFWGYHDILYKAPFELTFYGNMIVGVFLLVAGVYGFFRKKSLPDFMYFDAAMLLLLVMMVCLAFASTMNFSGAFRFMHLINPLSVIIYWLVFVSHTTDKLRKIIWTAPVVPLIFLVFLLLSGKHPYTFLDVNQKGLAYVICFIVITAVALMALSAIAFLLNKLVHKTLLKKFDYCDTAPKT
ncbi:Pr6Pr family membrane protein [Candidatus Saccharibacteria bacterium]|nr:Pr6Pr family membrane protein [Candidatus Saccharibacteria bacterium]